VSALVADEPPEHYTDENYRVEPIEVSGDIVWNEATAADVPDDDRETSARAK
jgi:hypothetical protein